jgi:hypothetical protein
MALTVSSASPAATRLDHQKIYASRPLQSRYFRCRTLLNRQTLGRHSGPFSIWRALAWLAILLSTKSVGPTARLGMSRVSQEGREDFRGLGCLSWANEMRVSVWNHLKLVNRHQTS